MKHYSCDICGKEMEGPFKPFPSFVPEERLYYEVIDIFPWMDVCIVCMKKINDFVRDLWEKNK